MKDYKRARSRIANLMSAIKKLSASSRIAEEYLLISYKP